MSQHFNTLSRAQLIGGVIATGVLAGCGRASNAVPSISPTIPPEVCTVTGPSGEQFGINDILSDKVFDNVDKDVLVAAFDVSPGLDSLQQVFGIQAGRQVQSANVILQIPSEGIVIQTPGTYTFGSNITWSPNDLAGCCAITIQCSNVTLNLGGFMLTASIADKAQQAAGIFVLGPVENITITNGTVAGMTEYGILARGVCGLNISQITVTRISMNNLDIRFLSPAGIHVNSSSDVAISNCSVTQLEVTSDSSAGIQLLQTYNATVIDCGTSALVNNDGAVQGFSYLKCLNVGTTRCTAESLQSHYNGNTKASGHTVLGFCPILCKDLSYVDCTASGLTGCCDDCHGMSVFLDAQVTVSGFQASNVVDGVSPSNSGAKATGLEVYGAGVTISNSIVNDIKAINPQNKQSTGFSAWGVDINFEGCKATNVTVVQDGTSGSYGMGFAWAPDPRWYLCYMGAWNVTYTDCEADQCDVGFDTWYHVNSTWTRPKYTNCTTDILVQPGGTRTLSADECSECNLPVCTAPLTVTLTNIASGNTYPS